MASRFKTAVLGGTFDHFHKGHKELIERGLQVCEKLVIGITSDRYTKEFKVQDSRFAARRAKFKVINQSFEDFKIRKKNLEEYLNKKEINRFEIVEIQDMFGPTLDKGLSVQAIVVSLATKKGADKINNERQKIGLKKLGTIIVEQVLARDGMSISSLRIRKGQIDRDGNFFIKPEWFEDDLIITPEIRQKLKTPWGNLSKSFEPDLFKNNQFVVSVGDETTRVLNKNNVPLGISVIDFKVAREKKFSDIKELGFSDGISLIKVTNPPGTLSAEMFRAARKVFGNEKNPQLILVDGEDDLAVLPLVLEAPLGVSIFYGQPGEGLVKIVVTEKIKADIFKIVSKFTPHHL